MNEKINTLRKKVEGHIGSNKDRPEYGETELREMMQEFKTVLEELQVADEELRTQNEELLAGHFSLVEERQRYQDLFEFTPDAYLVTDLMGVVREANQAAQVLLNIDYHYLIGKPLISYVSVTHRKYFRNLLAHTYDSVDIEITFKRRSGSDFEGAVRIAQIKKPGGEITGFRWIIRDITEHKRLAQKLHESQERFLKIFTHATPGIALLTRDRRIVDSNPAFQNLLQSSSEDLVNTDLTRFIIAEDKPQFHECFQRTLNASTENGRVEIRFTRKDNTVVCSLVSFSSMLHLKDGQPHIILFINDITEQKQIAAERVEMQHRVIDSIESERSHLARDLHDNPLQTLNGVLFLLADINSTGLDPENRQKFDQVRSIVRDVANALRVTCGELRSPSLNSFGLKKGIVAYFDRFNELYPGIEISLVFEGDHNHLPERLSLALYRILQESMANVLRHAEATHVDIRVKMVEDLISVRIADNGVGFQLPASMVDFMRMGHYGLAGIAERVEMIGGTLAIESAPWIGTVIEVSVDPHSM